MKRRIDTARGRLPVCRNRPWLVDIPRTCGWSGIGLGVLLNPWLLAWHFSPGGAIGGAAFYMILLFDASSILFGTWVLTGWRYVPRVLCCVLSALFVLSAEHHDILSKLVQAFWNYDGRPRSEAAADQAVLRRVIELDERRLTALEHETSELLYAVHQPVQTIEVRLPEQAILDTAMGIDPLLSGVFGGKVGFHVGLRVEGRPDVTLMRETHDLSSPVEEAARWHPVSIDLGRWPLHRQGSAAAGVCRHPWR